VLLLLAEVEALVQEEGRRDEERGRDDDGADPAGEGAGQREGCGGESESERARREEERERERETDLRPSGLRGRGIESKLESAYELSLKQQAEREGWCEVNLSEPDLVADEPADSRPRSPSSRLRGSAAAPRLLQRPRPTHSPNRN